MRAKTEVVAAGDLHLWRTTLDADREVVDELLAVLSPDELERAAKFHFARDRDRFIVGRAFMRAVVGGYVGRAPASLQFRYTEHRKPLLVGEAPAFNLSHADAVGLLAVARVPEIGVDLEPVRTHPTNRAVAERFFARDEVEKLLSLPAEQQGAAFLRCWTRKEAYLKARGDGLSLPLEDFDVSLLPDEEPRLLRTAWSVDEPAEWTLLDVSAAVPGYVAATALRGAIDAVLVREWRAASLIEDRTRKELYV